MLIKRLVSGVVNPSVDASSISLPFGFFTWKFILDIVLMCSGSAMKESRDASRSALSVVYHLSVSASISFFCLSGDRFEKPGTCVSRAFTILSTSSGESLVLVSTVQAPLSLSLSNTSKTSSLVFLFSSFLTTPSMSIRLAIAMSCCASLS